MMRVFFDEGFSARGKGLPGRAQWAGWRFAYGETRCFVPYIYHFAAGLAFDILLLADTKDITAFYKKYPPEEASRTKKPSRRAREAEQAHPLAPLPLVSAVPNGRACRSSVSYTFFCSIPWEVRPEAPMLRRAYPGLLAEKPFFACQRVFLRFTKNQQRRLAMGIPPFLRPWQPVIQPCRITGLSLELAETFQEHTAERQFSLGEGEKVSFSVENPAGGLPYAVLVRGAKEVDIPKTAASPALYALSATMQVTPPLPKGGRLQFNTGINLPREEISPAALKHEAEVKQSLCIIGGGDGPTALFIAPSRGEGGDACLSRPSLRKKPRYMFHLESLSLPLRKGQTVQLGSRERS